MAMSSSAVSVDQAMLEPSALSRDEMLSAACDGELTAAQFDALFAAIRTDLPDPQGGSQRRTWNTHHLVGDTLRMGEPPLLSAAFNLRMAAALEREPTILAPGASGARSLSSKALQTLPFRKPLWMGFSVAASVAAVAFVGYGAVSVWRGTDAAAPQLAKTTPATPAAPTTLAATTPAGVPVAATTASIPDITTIAPAVPNEYLVAHRQLSGGLALQGYTRAAFPVSAAGGAGQK